MKVKKSVARCSSLTIATLVICLALPFGREARGQLTDQTQTPNTAGEGIALSLDEQIGAGRGGINKPNSSRFIVRRDPFRAIRRGRQLFQRKFTATQGLGPHPLSDGIGDIETEAALGAGLADSCAACHGRPRGAAGFGGDVFTRPDSRDAPHLFGLGLQEMLADEITHDLRDIRKQALDEARRRRRTVSLQLVSKGIDFGTISATRRGSLDTSAVVGVDLDLRVRPFFAQGGTISIREFVVGAFKAEMGLESADPCLRHAVRNIRCTTPSGMVLDGTNDRIEAPPVNSKSEDGDGDGVTNEIDPTLVDFMEFYLLNYFKPGFGRQTAATESGFQRMEEIGCGTCHIRNLTIEHDRRVADVETVFDPVQGIFNRLFATAQTQTVERRDGITPSQLKPAGGSFLVANIFTDFKRHDLGPQFTERNFDGTMQSEFLTEPLWGVGSTPPYGHDGRSINLTEVILRHGGEAQGARDAFDDLSEAEQGQIIAALNSLVLFPPDDTASNLNPGDPTDPDFPQVGHGSINLGALFRTDGPE